MLGVIIPGVAMSAEDEESAKQLKAAVRTSTPEEVNETCHGGSLQRPRKIVCGSCQAGRFAAATALIVTTSSVVELSTVHLNFSDLLAETQKCVRKGIITDPLMKLLELEQAFEAPFSFALSCYNWNFAAVADPSGFALISGIITLLLGMYTLAEAAYFFGNLDLYYTKPRSENEKYGLLAIEAQA
eukprot:s234_g30.t1